MTVSDDVRLGARRAATHAEQAVHTVAPWIEKLAHLGYAAKGLVYVAIGALAIGVAAGAGGAVTDSRGVLASIAREPFGLVVIVLAALGFGGYSVWQAVAAIFDPERRGRGWKGAFRRIGFAGSSVFHAGLAAACVRLLVGAHRVSNDRLQRTWIHRAFALPFGTWIVGAIGVGVVVYGAYQLYVASRGKLDRRLRIELIEPGVRRAFVPIARFGLAARGVVFALAGVFLVKASLDYDPSEVRTMRGTLRALQHQAYGPWLLGVVAAGLIAYGGYLFAEARYRHIRAA